MLVNHLLSAVSQVLLFSLLPLLFYVVRKNKIKGFFAYIGLITPLKKTLLISLLSAVMSFIFIIVLFSTYPDLYLWELLKTPGTLTAEIAQIEPAYMALIIIIIKSTINTGLSEEILFRGFLGKRLIERFGFGYGNTMQGAIFGLLHGLLFLSTVGLSIALLISLIIGIIGFLLGYLNERLGNGSIIPSWIAHSLANISSFSIIIFLI
jgi:uncharacterized protein